MTDGQTHSIHFFSHPLIKRRREGDTRLPKNCWSNEYRRYIKLIITNAYPGSEVIKRFLILNSAEHEIFPANKYKMPTIVGILIFISRKKICAQFCCVGRKFNCWYLIFLWAEQISFSAELSMKKSFITSGPDKIYHRVSDKARLIMNSRLYSDGQIYL